MSRVPTLQQVGGDLWFCCPQGPSCATSRQNAGCPRNPGHPAAAIQQPNLWGISELTGTKHEDTSFENIGFHLESEQGSVP